MQAMMERSTTISSAKASNLEAGTVNTVVDTIRVFTTPAQLAQARSDWQGLEAMVPEAAYFSSFDWCECWWTWFGRDSGRELAVLAVYTGDALQAVLPLMIARTWFFSSARLVGDDTGQYADCSCPRRGLRLAPAWPGPNDAHKLP